MTTAVSDIGRRVELFLASESDVEGESWEELVAILDDAIKVIPDARLFCLRARMFIASNEPYSAMCDWEQALVLAPTEREPALALACLRLERADYLAELAVQREKCLAHGSAMRPENDDTEDSDDDPAEDEDWDDVDVERAEALARHYISNAGQSLIRLIYEHVADLEFLHCMFDSLHGLHRLDIWFHYTLLLKVLAVHPDDLTLRVHEAQCLARLAYHGIGETDEIPLGCWESPSGMRVHVITIERAVRCIDEVCALAPQPDLLVSKADMFAAIEHYPAASAAYRQAAQLFDSAANCAGNAHEELAGKAESARKEAELCLQGRQAINIANAAAMEESMHALADMRARMGHGTDGSDELMEEALRVLRGAHEQSEKAMTDQQRAEYRHMAESVAQQTMNMVSLTEIELHPISRARLKGGLIPWFDNIRLELEHSGLKLGQQFDNPSSNRVLGEQCQSQWWTDGSGASAIVVEAVGTLTVRRVLTELSDQSFIVTADDRCRSFWQFGPAIDSLSVDGNTSMASMIDLHLARVARALAHRPDLRAKPINSLSRLAEAENRMRIAKRDFRHRVKITDIEVRGMHVQFHDAFRALLEAAMERKIADISRAECDVGIPPN